jgi:hypothetical protein
MYWYNKGWSKAYGLLSVPSEGNKTALKDTPELIFGLKSPLMVKIVLMLPFVVSLLWLKITYWVCGEINLISSPTGS